MKKISKNIVLAALVAELFAPGITTAAESFTQEIQVFGKIVNDTRCSVTISPTLNLGEVIDTNIKTSDQAPQVFDGAMTIGLKNCSTEQTIFSISLLGIADSSDSSLLVNSQTVGAASNVGVGVWTFPEFKQMTVGGEAITFVKEAGTDGAGINIVVALAKSDGSKDIEVGQVESSAQFKVDYL